MSKMPKGQPQSVADPDAAPYDETMRRQKARNEKLQQVLEFAKSHPGAAESVIPVWGSAREAVADGFEGDAVGAVVNGVLAGSDLLLGGAAVKGVAKGAVFVAKEG